MVDPYKISLFVLRKVFDILIKLKMKKITFNDQTKLDTYTLVSDTFILNVLSTLNEIQIKVYLLGLYSINKNIDVIDIANNLNIEYEDLVAVLKELQELNLVIYEDKISPATVSFLNPKTGKLFQNFNTDEFNEFEHSLSKLIPERFFSPTELNEYFTFIKNKNFEQTAFAVVLKYCMKIKNEKIGYKYILKVAEGFAAKGLKTAVAVEEEVNKYYNSFDSIKNVSLKMGKKYIENEDYQLFNKWLETFELGEIIQIINSFKAKSFQQIDSILEMLDSQGIRGVQSIEQYKELYDERKAIAISINKKLGLFYTTVDNEIETYIIPWTNMGYTKKSIDKIAQYCFENNGKTLGFLNEKIHELSQLGITTEDGVDAHFAALKQNDKKLKELFKLSGFSKTISQNDRDMFKVWINNWGFDFNTLKFLAKRFEGDVYWQSKINNVLSKCKSQNLYNIEDIDKFISNLQPTKKKGGSYDMITSTDVGSSKKIEENTI